MPTGIRKSEVFCPLTSDRFDWSHENTVFMITFAVCVLGDDHVHARANSSGMLFVSSINYKSQKISGDLQTYFI